MGLFNNGQIKALQAQVLSLQEAVTRNFLAASRNFVNQNLPVYPSWNLEKQLERYSNTDDIFSIVSRIAKTSARIPLFAYEVQADGNLIDLPDTDKLYQLLENPHFVLSKYQFRQAIHTLLLMQGKVYLYKFRQNQFTVNAQSEVVDVNEGPPIKLEIMLRQNIVEHVNLFPNHVTKYDYVVNGITVIADIPPEDMIVISLYGGIAPVDVLGLRLVQVDGQNDAITAQMQNGGVPGIVYDKADTGEEVPTSNGGTALASDLRKNSFYKYASNKANKGAPYFSSGELGYIQLGLPLADLDVAKLSGISFKKLCNAFSVSDRLFNNDATGSEVSDDNARKALYTDACLPNVELEKDALMQGLIYEFATDKKKRVIKEDLSEIPALQDDMLKMAQAVAALPSFVPNEVRAMFKLEKSEDPNADKLYIKTGYTALEDLQGSQDLPITDDYNQNPPM